MWGRKFNLHFQMAVMGIYESVLSTESYCT
jgi:hypothetical protein